jgi:hypothetical protein
VVTGLKHQKEKRSMDHFAGLDVSVKDTSICIVDDTGKIIRDRRNRICTLPKHGFCQATCFDPIIGAMMLKALRLQRGIAATQHGRRAATLLLPVASLAVMQRYRTFVCC